MPKFAKWSIPGVNYVIGYIEKNIYLGGIVTFFWISLFVMVTIFSLCNSSIPTSAGSRANEVELKVNSTPEGIQRFKIDLDKHPDETQCR